MSLSTNTRQAIRDYLYEQLARYIHENADATAEIDTKPFHTRLLPALFSVQLSERSFSTRSGSWFQEIARLVATQYHAEAQLCYNVHGQLQPAASAHIKAILDQMDKGTPKRIPNREHDIHEVLTVQSPNGAAQTVTADLFIRRNNGRELYFEMKTPSPNKGQCRGMKEFILQVMAMRKGHDAHAYASTAYNPYGDASPYTWTYARQFLEIGQDIIVGRPFWTMIGEQSTYDELLQIADEVGHQALPLLAQTP